MFPRIIAFTCCISVNDLSNHISKFVLWLSQANVVLAVVLNKADTVNNWNTHAYGILLLWIIVTLTLMSDKLLSNYLLDLYFNGIPLFCLWYLVCTFSYWLYLISDKFEVDKWFLSCLNQNWYTRDITARVCYTTRPTTPSVHYQHIGIFLVGILNIYLYFTHMYV